MRPESDACHAWPTSATWRKPAALAAPVHFSYLESFTTVLLTALTLWVGINRATLVDLLFCRRSRRRLLPFGCPQYCRRRLRQSVCQSRSPRVRC